MKIIVFILTALCVSVIAQESFETAGARIAFKIFEDCTAADVFSFCLKKKAATFMDRLERMDKLSLINGVTIIRDQNVHSDDVKENQTESILQRSNSDKEDALNAMLLNKISKFVGSRSIEITVPKFSPEIAEEGRKGSGGGGGGKGGKKGMMGGLMMAVAAKMAAMIPVAIAGLFLLAGKALITAKIALLISGIIAIKKLFAAKQGGGTHVAAGWQSSGHGGGWQSGGGGGGGGWDKRSIQDYQNLAYNIPKQF